MVRVWLLLPLLLASGCPGQLSGGVPSAADGAEMADAGAPPPAVQDGGLDRGVSLDGTAATDGLVAPDAAPPSVPGVWQPVPGTTWHWQLTGTVDQSVNATMYDIDLFTSSAATIATLKAKGRVVICYFSAGSYESWRPDAKDFPQSAVGDKMDGWDEQWLDIRSTGVRDVMKQRLDLASSKGCDGVEPDNVDGYANDTGFPLTAADQIDYNTFLAAEAHKRGLSVGLKNDVEQVKQLEPYFDWALNEECVQYNECNLLAPFIQAGKAVFHVEYTPATKTSVCPKVTPLKLDSQIKKLELDAWYLACWS